MLHLYIDTNAYLTFYHLTSDDIEELKKLQSLTSKTAKKIKLYLPEQTYDEFNRNREVKIADGLKRFKEEKLNNQFPQMSKEYPEYKGIRDAIREFDNQKSKLLEKLMEDILTKKLAADILIEQLFANSEFHETTDSLIRTAKIRYDLGKPPGKNGSYGDALNWETLLQNVPNGEDLFFISDDKDYYSEINTSNFNSYLRTEWNKKKSSPIHCYRRISEFFKEQFPSIKIAADYEKDLLIEELVLKRTFSGARSVLQKISSFDNFSSDQLNDFVRHCVMNSQVYWIKDDEDIKTMISQIVMPNRDKIEPSILAEFDTTFQYEIK